MFPCCQTISCVNFGRCHSLYEKVNSISGYSKSKKQKDGFQAVNNINRPVVNLDLSAYNIDFIKG